MIDWLVHKTLKRHFPQVMFWVRLSADSGSVVTFDVECTIQMLTLKQQGVETAVLRKKWDISIGGKIQGNSNRLPIVLIFVERKRSS